MANFNKLTKENVVEKEFEIEYKGYKVEEVDSFLDIISEDYKYFIEKDNERTNIITKLKEEINRLVEENKSILANLELNEKQLEKLSRAGLSSSAIIKRIAALEKETLGK